VKDVEDLGEDTPVIGSPKIAAIIGVSPRVVRSMCANGEIDATPRGRAWMTTRKRLRNSFSKKPEQQ
jgi:hypothetical protein